MRIRAFTVVELIIVVVLVGILSAIGYPLYLNVKEDANTRVCESHQAALQAAADAYIREKNTVPATISMLPGEYIQKAYAQVQAKDGFALKLAEFISESGRGSVAYAQALITNNPALTICPSSTTGKSYAFNKIFRDGTVTNKQQYADLPPGTLIIADSDADEFDESTLSGVSSRHAYYVLLSKKNYAIMTDNSNESYDSRNTANLNCKDVKKNAYISCVAACTTEECKKNCRREAETQFDACQESNPKSSHGAKGRKHHHKKH